MRRDRDSSPGKRRFRSRGSQFVLKRSRSRAKKRGEDGIVIAIRSEETPVTFEEITIAREETGGTWGSHRDHKRGNDGFVRRDRDSSRRNAGEHRVVIAV